jgi:hypothetical protein
VSGWSALLFSMIVNENFLCYSSTIDYFLIKLWRSKEMNPIIDNDRIHIDLTIMRAMELQTMQRKEMRQWRMWLGSS